VRLISISAKDQAGKLKLLRSGSGIRFGMELFLSLAVAVALCVSVCAQQADTSQVNTSQSAQATASPDAATPVSPTPDDATDDDPETMLPHFKTSRIWLSGQGNFIFQTHPPFHADYSGKNSLDPNYEKATSRVMTLYTGVRVNNSVEFLVDIEDAAGAGMSNSLGLAGITNLDVVRIPGEGTPLSTAPYLARAQIHKVFALSKDKIENTRNQWSLFEELPRRRLEVRFGKFDLADFFDTNSVGSDTHFQFTNWTIDNNGAWDYAADTRGYTVGLTGDYEDRNWGLRFAEALMPIHANGINMVWRPWQVHAENWEYELRHGVIPKKAGVVRLLAYTNYANMGIYRQQNILAAEEGTAPDIDDHPCLGINLEQNLTHYLTAFGRFGWDNGKTESFCYTEDDQTFSGGVGASGAWWRRKQDRAGVAFATNAIKKDHQDYLAAGGLGFLLGDGALNYGREDILETYYTAHIWRGIYLAPGFQHINNPGYNRDRGPVIVPSFRAHVEF
jgi:high affinity Mn2+ porin